MLNLMMVTLWLSVFSILFRLNLVNAEECPSLVFRNDARSLLRLSNCTAILGSLTITLITDINNADEINQLSFPKLKEITGCLLFYNVVGLNSTGSLFPNLIVIRGQELCSSYSLVIFKLPHLTEIGFKSLISIQRGYVIIEQCPTLCYFNTIDWEKLTDEEEEDIGAGTGNMLQEVAPICPTRGSCRQCKNQNCWSSKNCQKDKKSHYTRGVNPCHPLCLGGCVNKTADGCFVCSGLKLNGTCVEECPKDFFILRETMRCVPDRKCIDKKLIPFNGECLRQCPHLYSNHDPITNQNHEYKCFKCKIKCQKSCAGMEIRGPAELEYYRGCNVVEGSLSIKLGLNMTDIKEKLEQTLGAIETINGVLKIYRSFSLTSLSFFRNLELINATWRGVGDPHAIEITQNDNLQTLFDWKEKLSFTIVGGGMSFHFNSKLCVDEIHSFQRITKYNNTHDAIQLDTNGYDEICHATGIYAFDFVHSHSNASIYWNSTDFGSNKTLMGYFVFYLETPLRNISYFSGLDACSTKKFKTSTLKDLDMPMISKRSNSISWQSVFVPFEDLKTDDGYFVMTLTNLKQYTQYAYYIRTRVSLKHHDEILNVTQGQSQVKYFTTLPDIPKPPIVRTKDKTNTTLTLEWNPSTPENELVQKYFIDVYVLIDDNDEIDKRNYCQNPKTVNDAKEYVTKTPEVICCRDQKAYLEYFKRDGNQTCGKNDPSCELTYEYVLFHRHVEYALLMADLQKEPSRRYKPKLNSHESPKHHKGTTDPIKRLSEHSKYYLHSHIIDDKHTDSVVVPNLKPFHLYAFYVFACNNVSNCSDYYLHSDRTKPYIYADDAHITAFPDESRQDIYTLIIQQPVEPNGATVAYEIETYDLTRNIGNVKCITRKEMEAMKYTYRIENLLYGTHSFRVRTLSLGENGNFSEMVVVEIDKLSNDTYNSIWGISLTFIVIFLIIIITTSYQKFKVCRVPQTHDNDYLLRERSDSGHSIIQQPISSSESTQTTRKTKRNVATHGAKKSLSHSPTSDGIQMTVFKSNVPISLDQPSSSGLNLTKSSSFIPVQSSHPNVSTFEGILEPFHPLYTRGESSTQRTDMDNSEGITLQDDLLPYSPGTTRRFDSDYTFPLLPQ